MVPDPRRILDRLREQDITGHVPDRIRERDSTKYVPDWRWEQYVPERIRRSYVAKFGLVILVVLVLTIGSAGFFYAGMSDEITQDTHERLQYTAEVESQELHGQLDTHEQLAERIANDDRIVDQLGMEIGSRLSIEGAQTSQEVRAIHYVDLETNRITQSSERGVGGDDVSELGLQVHAWEGDSIAQYEYDEVDLTDLETTHTDTFEHDGRNVIAFLSHVDHSDRDGAIMVVVSADLLAQRFHEPLEGSYTEVVDTTDGNVMISADETSTLTTYREGADQRIVDQEISGSAATEFDDTDEVAAYTTVPSTDWVLVTHAPQSSAYALADSVMTSLAALIAVALAGFLVIGATIGRSTANALETLSDNATALSRGETDIEIDDDERIDEVGQVRDSFDDIRAYLETATAQSDAIARQEFDDPVLEEDVPGTLGDSLAAMGDDLESYISDVEAAKAEAERSQAEAAEARQEAEELAERLERKASEFGRVMGIAADGDLTRRLDDDVDNEALAEIATAFNEMLEELEGTIVDIQSLSADVDRISRDVTTRVEEIEKASGEVSRSAEEIATATSDQSDRFQEVYGEMNDLSATVQEIASTADDVATVSSQAATKAEVAGEASSEIRTEMDHLEQRAESISEQIGQLDEEMDEISEIVDLIDEIADQTNLLALNASIEAASAGAEGDGFAVVASEVKSLAEETGDATQEVDDLVTSVQSSVDETVTEIERMREQVDEGATVVDEGIEAIEAITEQVETANESIQSVNDATDEQARASGRVVEMVDEATEISEETNAETETVAAAAEEQTATVSEVASGAQSLTEMADDLRASLAVFDVDERDSTEVDVVEYDENRVGDELERSETGLVLKHDEAEIDESAEPDERGDSPTDDDHDGADETDERSDADRGAEPSDDEGADDGSVDGTVTASADRAEVDDEADETGESDSSSEGTEPHEQIGAGNTDETNGM
ncbi:methyl-accepting chemotaxis protein [Natrarchaeobius oligotrophus]|uniref:HAMP domain-containing protein n=1 Tax=Natrarchaeobius chitinivorans TaxID=1679083 RepID=A0A3N6MD38_NATCH|nr:methyl-accepting chemotaxis protein [Natrarchaeobius chitinivorans]RQH01844.1 HAMP domain-containing protein [Natrarchaeobius chitinivorans]